MEAYRGMMADIGQMRSAMEQGLRGWLGERVRKRERDLGPFDFHSGGEWSNGKMRRGITCFNCGKSGHSYRYCRAEG